MDINEKKIEQWSEYWRNYIGNYQLPSWDSIPDFGLYMDQVVTYVRNCLKYLENRSDSESVITAPAINNYVRKKLMPQPLKKRYYRSHLAYLLILCALKPSLSITEIHELIPLDTGEDELRKFYEAFIEKHKRAADFFMDKVETLKKLVTKDEFLGNSFKDPAMEIVLDVALISSFTKSLTDKLFLTDEAFNQTIGKDISTVSESPDDAKTP
ncbi:MAG: DUF1836 domain-containing protein [Firmicutes bacterium]|nr:DUF1836 domain-containing protein [Bacillota bacterium]MBQ5441244.1 DUF1836 domain-containing protein [Bacillota bacterium]